MREERIPRRRRQRFDDDRRFADKRRELATPRQLTIDPVDPLGPLGPVAGTGFQPADEPDLIPGGADRWSTWDSGRHGPQPHPSWLVTELAAVDAELGVLKTGKEADVHLIERFVPGGPSCLLAAKRYRSAEHRMFHRDSSYLEGRRVRKSRETRAMTKRTAFGRDVIAAQWAVAEFEALCRLCGLGAPVPYPAQLAGTELLCEFIGDPDGTAAPRLAQLRPNQDELHDLWQQLVEVMVLFATDGLTHGDLSAFNLLVHHGRLVVIDVPQVVDVVSNPQGLWFLNRDIQVITRWFASRGLPPEVADPLPLTELLYSEAGLS